MSLLRAQTNKATRKVTTETYHDSSLRNEIALVLCRAHAKESVSISIRQAKLPNLDWQI